MDRYSIVLGKKPPKKKKKIIKGKVPKKTAKKKKKIFDYIVMPSSIRGTRDSTDRETDFTMIY